MTPAARVAGGLLLLLPLLLLVLLVAGGRAAAVGPRCPPAAACRELHDVTGEYAYQVDGETLMVYYTAVKSFKLVCPPNVSLDSASLPRFAAPAGFGHVILERCALPARPLAAALAALRVAPQHSLDLLDVPAAPALTRAHLEGLPVRSLKVEASTVLNASEDCLAALPQLEDLRMRNVRLPGAALLALPAGLRALGLAASGARALPRAALARLPRLRALRLREPLLAAAPDLTAAPALADLWLAAPLLDTLLAGPALENVTLIGMNLTSIGGNCSALVRLTAVGARALPAADWARCPRLRELRLRRAAAAALVPDLLRTAPALRDLDLSSNDLPDLPSGLFGASLQLERLALAGNALRAGALAALEPYTALRALDLARNPLGDLCPAAAAYRSNGLSALRGLRALRELSLRATRVPALCRDWRDAALLPALARLDLRDNLLLDLAAEEAAWPRGELDLRGNPVRAVVYTREDFERALAAPPRPENDTTTVLLDSELKCDCLVYWFARALRERPRHVPAALAAVRCAAPPPGTGPPAPAGPPAVGPELRAVPLEDLECAVPEAECVAGCACAVSGERSALRCAGAGLRALPAAPRLPPPRALLLPHNNISALPPSLPPELELLDLRHNALAELDAGAARALLAGGRRARLAGNPLRCACAQRDALALLQAHADQLDADDITCADGRALRALRPAELCAPLAPLLGALLAAALLAALLALLCLARPAARHQIKRFLVQHNLCLRLLLRPDRVEPPEPPAPRAADDERPERRYDVFVSFSHHDHKFVEEELVPLLEGAARPRRLCLHYRDWTPGEWIPTQITESVRVSRRTLVVVSAGFVRSRWARAEFRAALALALRSARARLVLLLLAPPAALPLDPELRAALRSHTYLRRDDPRFKDKLLDALPASAPPAAPTSAPPAPSAAPTSAAPTSAPPAPTSAPPAPTSAPPAPPAAPTSAAPTSAPPAPTSAPPVAPPAPPAAPPPA